MHASINYSRLGVNTPVKVNFNIPQAMTAWIKNKIFIFFCCLSLPLMSQTKEDLQDKGALQSEIKFINELLNQAKLEKNNSINTLSTLSRKIGIREEMISTLNIEIELFNGHIQKMEAEEGFN